MTIEQFVADRKSEGNCSLTSSLLEYAALRRGLDVERLDRRDVLVELSDDIWLPFIGLDGPDTSHAGAKLCTYRDVQRLLIRDSGLPVPRFNTYSAAQFDDALAFASEIGWPVTVAPTRCAGGATEPVAGSDDFHEAWRRARQAYPEHAVRRPVFVQECHPGREFRIIVVGERVVSVTRRDPPSVVGDGLRSVGELIRQKNAERKTNPCLGDYLIPDDVAFLRDSVVGSHACDDVPKPGERVALSRATSLAAGADVVDVTDEVPALWRDLAIDAMRVLPGLVYAEVHLVALNKSVDSMTAVITEVSHSPVPAGHFPAAGEPRDIAGAIVEHYLNSARWAMHRKAVHEVPEASQLPPGWIGADSNGSD